MVRCADNGLGKHEQEWQRTNARCDLNLVTQNARSWIAAALGSCDGVGNVCKMNGSNPAQPAKSVD